MKKKSIKRCISILLIIIMGLSIMGGMLTNGIIASAETNGAGISNPRISDDGTVIWDKVEFGSYYQDIKEWEKQPIKWRMLSVNEDGTDAFLISDMALDCKSYNENGIEKTREEYDEENGWVEVPFDSDNNGDCTSRIAEPTLYASGSGQEYQIQWWWLRSQTGKKGIIDNYYDYCAAGVTSGGFVGNYVVHDNLFGVRPAMHVDITQIDEWVTVTGSENVDNLISLIGNVTLDKKEVIETARKKYNELTESEKEKVTKISTLEAAEAKLAELEKQAKEVEDKAETEKQEITAASEVDKLITSIGTVSANSKTAIDTARKAYNELSDGAKAKVTKLSVLETAEKTLADIEKNTNNTGNNSDNNQNTTNQQASTEQQQTTQQPTSTEQSMVEEKVVVPAKTTIASLKNSKSKSFVAIWEKVKDAKGYEVQYALNKKFTKSKKTKTITSASKVSFTFKKLKKGKTYYIRVRAYNTDSKGSKVYGKWSVVKKVKIKK